MRIEDLLQEKTSGDVIEILKDRRGVPHPDVEKAEQALDPKKHKINSKVYRPDKQVKVDPDDPSYAGSSDGYRTEKVARVSLGLQKLIIKRAVAFLFGNPVRYNADTLSENEEVIMKALSRILHDVKENSLNRKVARAVFSYKECAELWYPVPVDKTKTGNKFINKVTDLINNALVNKFHKNYGFKSAFKLKCALFSPAFGDKLYPYFDETGDMLAFSREFTRNESGKKIEYFECYTSEKHWMWKKDKEDFVIVDGYPIEIAIGKIPVIYAYQEEFETEDVDLLIDRLELLLSNFADTNDYHASPKIFVKGELRGFSKKGESGAIIEGEDGSDAKYLSWENAPESVKLEIETLLEMIYTITQTPDISFNSVKGIGSISGIALKLLFMDAHLKVQDKREIFDEYLQRRVNVVKAFIGKLNTKLVVECEEIEIEPEITPYMLTSEIDEVNYWMTANGNKPIISQRQSIKNAGLTNDPDEDFEQIMKEESRENTFMIGEPTDA